QWEDAGRDCTDYPGLDTAARDLASRYAALGIGRGFDPDAPDEEHAERLWEVLRAPDRKPPPRHDPKVLRRAAELVVSSLHGTAQYDGPLTFSSQRWAEYLARNGIPWPRLPSGALALDDDTFKEMARAYPADVGPVREVLRIHRGEL